MRSTQRARCSRQWYKGSVADEVQLQNEALSMFEIDERYSRCWGCRIVNLLSVSESALKNKKKDTIIRND